jgi:hypothetical protein
MKARMPFTLSLAGPAMQLVNVDRPSPPTLEAKETSKPPTPSTPADIQALVDAHRSGIPILVIMSPSCTLMPFTLPIEYAYVYLGLFRIIELHVSRPPV